MRRLALLLTIPLGAGCSPTPASSPTATVVPSPTATVAASVVPSPSPTARADLRGEIAYVAGQDPQIHLLDLATGESRQLTDLKPEHAITAAQGLMRPVLTCHFGPGGLAWSPDGSQLAFSYGGCDRVLYAVDLDGAMTRIGDGQWLAWTPDGSGIVFAPNTPFCIGTGDCNAGPRHPGDRNLHVFDFASGAEPKPLSDDPMIRSARPTFSPDGSLIAFAGALPDPEADPDQLGGAYVIGADGSNLRLVALGMWAAGWLPDGRLLIVEEGAASIHVMDLDTGETEALGADAGLHAVSPDGSRVLLTTFEPGAGPAHVRVATIDGEVLAELEGWPAAWAPDSSAAVLTLSTADEARLVFISRDGKEVASFVVPDAGYLGDAAWRPGS